MVSLQILNKILISKNSEILVNNGFTEEYFAGYENEYNFIKEHMAKYGRVPDRETFLDKFQNFSIIEVTENEAYLVEALREEYLYNKTVPIITEMSEKIKSNSFDAIDFISTKLPELQNFGIIGGRDIAKYAKDRYDLFLARMNAEDPWYIPSGFPELDDILHGFAKGEEFAVIVARSGQGKSWLITKMISHAWQIGYRAGIISPEMTPIKIGYRVDTLLANFSNKGLTWANENTIDLPTYEKHVNTMAERDGLIIATPLDFQKQITVSKLRTFIKVNKLDILGIDGITYLSDERTKRSDNKTTGLTNISEDLMALSIELGIPIIAAVQSNREGANGDAPGLEHIRDSDGIAHNASKVFSLMQKGPVLELAIRKHRDGEMAGKINYHWNIDIGEFIYTPTDKDSTPKEKRKKRLEETKTSFDQGDKGIQF